MLERALIVSVVSMSVAYADPRPPAVDVVKELRAIGTKAARPDPRLSPAADPGCTALAKPERAAVKQRVLAWIDAQHSDERASSGSSDGLELVLDVGCKDASGITAIVVGQDRGTKKKGADTTRRNYVLRVGADTIDVVAERTSSPSSWWSEWADEGGYRLVAQSDLDGDGARDLVFEDLEHEGGSTITFGHLAVRRATGAIAPIATILNYVGARLVGGQLVIGGATREGYAHYGCVGQDLFVKTCTAAADLQRQSDRQDIAARYANMIAGEVPDRELLLSELATLGVKARAALVAAAPETSPAQRAQRKVTQFLAKAGIDDELQKVVIQAHAEARSYLDGLATKLGDRACTSTPLADADRAKLADWVKRQDAKADQVELAPAACGPYVWAAWTPTGDNKRREVLLALDGTTRVLGFTYDSMGGPGWSPFAHEEAFFGHGDAIVGIVLHDQNVWIVSGGKAVAQSKGTVAMYRYDRRWNETAIDLVVDGGTVWHATPTGRDKLDPQLVGDHEARRAAIERMLDNGPSSDPAYLAALRALGADAALIAACKALP